MKTRIFFKKINPLNLEMKYNINETSLIFVFPIPKCVNLTRFVNPLLKVDLNKTLIPANKKFFNDQ